MDTEDQRKERRGNQVAVPDDIKERLTALQHHALAQIEGFGWSVGFVRRPLFQDEVVVLFDPSGQQHAILNEDGSLDRSPDIQIR